ncbi:hypothetical protein BSL78_15196 [Apostichopus japonicus]|uniref:Uncharacterized protein n=1 Tax=Stichopus japonicus TaxID=307972 RepID=A0A2G8KIV5_STIJA|nr:hypothetical protein BSL78_15196 [Apostichopus japonicus]
MKLQEKTERFINQHKQQACEIKDKLAEYTKERKRGLEDIGCKRRDNDRQINVNLEKELRQVRKKYETIRKTANQENDKESEEFINKCDKTEGPLLRKLVSLEANFKNLKTANDLLVNRNEDELKQIREYCEQVIKRYENVKATTSSILASKDDWTDAQCIPNIRAACKPLIGDMKKEYLELESLSDFFISDITKVIKDNITIAQHEQLVVYVAGIKIKGWFITDITSRGNVMIVITHKPSERYSHITVFNRRGEVQRQDQIKMDKGMPICGLLFGFKAVTWDDWYEVGMYDVRDGAFSKKNIRDVITRWPSDQEVSCVTTDPVKNHIIVGTDSRHVYVFTDQMNYSHLITLPDVIDGSYDITVHRNSLLVCDNLRGRAYAVTIQESQSRLMYEFTKPDLDGLDWNPITVCTDQNEFIYMLWQTSTSHQRRPILVQYSQDGRQLLTTRIVENNVYHLSTIEENGMEKLLMTTTVGSFHTFDLVVT